MIAEPGFEFCNVVNDATWSEHPDVPVVLKNDRCHFSVGALGFQQQERAGLDLCATDYQRPGLAGHPDRRHRIALAKLAQIIGPVEGRQNIRTHGAGVHPKRPGRHVRKRISFAAAQKRNAPPKEPVKRPSSQKKIGAGIDAYAIAPVPALRNLSNQELL